MLEREVFDEPLPTQQSQTSLNTETTDSDETSNDSKSPGHMNPPWENLEQINPTNETMKLLLTRSDSTDSGVPPSPCNQSNDRDPMLQNQSTVCLLPSVTADFTSVANSKFSFDGGSVSKSSSSSLRLDTRDMSFCNGGYLQQESSQTDRLSSQTDGSSSQTDGSSSQTERSSSISSEPNNNVAESTGENWNAMTSYLPEVYDADLNGDTHLNLGEMSSTSLLSVVPIVPSQHPTSNNDVPHHQGSLPVSPDGTMSAPYFQVGLSSRSSPVAVLGSSMRSHNNQIVPVQDRNDDQTIVDYLACNSKEVLDAKETYLVRSQGFRNKKEDVITSSFPQLVDVSNDAEWDSSSQLADFVAHQLLVSNPHMNPEGHDSVIAQLSDPVTSDLPVLMQNSESEASVEKMDSDASNLHAPNLVVSSFHHDPLSEMEETDLSRPRLARMASSCSSTAYVCVSRPERTDIKANMEGTDEDPILTSGDRASADSGTISSSYAQMTDFITNQHVQEMDQRSPPADSLTTSNPLVGYVCVGQLGQIIIQPSDNDNIENQASGHSNGNVNHNQAMNHSDTSASLNQAGYHSSMIVAQNQARTPSSDEYVSQSQIDNHSNFVSEDSSNQ